MLIVDGKILDHHKKAHLKAGSLILLKTKYGSYPARITRNDRDKQEVSIETDPFMYWNTWKYSQIELIDNKVKKILYGK